MVNIVYILNCFILCNSIINIHFKKKFNPSNINENFNYYEYLTKNDLMIEISIGIPPQKIELKLKNNMELFYLTNPLSQGKFYSNKSNTFYSNFSEIYLSKEKLEKGFIAKDNIFLNFQKNNQINEKSISDISFLYISKPNATIINLGSFGLSYHPDSKYKELNILYQLNSKNIINNYGYYFQYISDTEGIVYLGEYPHDYNKSYYDKLDFYYINTPFNDYWCSYFKTTFYGNEIVDTGNYFYLNTSLGGIVGGRFFLNKIETLFFQNKKIINGKCKTNKNKEFTFFDCDIDVNIKNFQNLSFYNHFFNYTFVLTYEDLFEIINGRIYCKLIFINDMSSTWRLGQPFLKKYMFIFDNEKKLFGIYKKIKQKGNFISLLMLIILILMSIIIFLSIIIRKIIINKPRRIKAKELENDIKFYEFSS